MPCQGFYLSFTHSDSTFSVALFLKARGLEKLVLKVTFANVKIAFAKRSIFYFLFYRHFDD